MSADGFKILHWADYFDGPWSPGGLNKYQSGHFDGLSLLTSVNSPPADLLFLADLVGLRSFYLRARVSNDLDAFRVVTLEDLTLVTGSRRVVPKVVQPSMRNLCLTDRPGISAVRWPALESLRIGMWRGRDLEFVRGAEQLRTVRLEGRRQHGSLTGIEECVALEEFVSIDYSIETTKPLAGLTRLRQVSLMAAPPASPHGEISFADLAGANLQKIWVSNAVALRDVGALDSLPHLRELRLVECRLTDRDMKTLGRLRDGVDVKVIDPRV